MSLSIFDVDGIHSETIDKNDVKLFSKDCGYGTQSRYRLRVEVGEAIKDLCDDDAVVVFKLNNIFKGADWTINADNNNHELELIFRGWESCGAFLQALRFSGEVLTEAVNHIMCPQEERTF